MSFDTEMLLNGLDEYEEAEKVEEEAGSCATDRDREACEQVTDVESLAALLNARLGGGGKEKRGARGGGGGGGSSYLQKFLLHLMAMPEELLHVSCCKLEQRS
eukprot:767427-Hanusia_phi.AAC.2